MVHAHRSYMYALSKYKLLRYGAQKTEVIAEDADAIKDNSSPMNMSKIGEGEEDIARDPQTTFGFDWAEVDADLIKCITLYR